MQRGVVVIWVDFGVIAAGGMRTFGNAVVIWVVRCECLVWFLL